jgi:DNA-binding response OmpR family regulator
VKPFALEELRARLRALLRRESSDKSALIKIADLSLDPATHFVERAGQRIELTAKEFALLEYFMRSPNRVISREMAESHIWSFDFQSTSNVVDVYIRRLRRKIDDPFETKLFETIRGAGYRLVSPQKNGKI